MRLAVAEGVKLQVMVEGQGEPVVLLHGHSLDLTVFDEVVPPLVAAGFQVIRYDQRGHGGSSCPPFGYGWGDHVNDLLGVLTHLGLSSAHLVGLSKGGGIALEAALRTPQRVQSLALIGPLVPDYPLPAAFGAFFKVFARTIREQGVAAAVREHWLPHPLLRSAWENPSSREKLERIVLRFPAGEYVATRRDEPDRSWSVLDRLGDVAVPALLLVGQREIPEFRAMVDLLAARLPQAQLVIIPESGHLVPLEQPEKLAACLLGFLAGLGVRKIHGFLGSAEAQP
ncbi:MAG: alpha/beta fold hydrolase [Thermoanaerobaculum sp.]|nr:alpha/beta fold hydrolase [Thermoanaerobaculum sp.]MDW7967672.1 alpha/beta fold hydrolase [Thermoanaerobaculum sp.]